MDKNGLKRILSTKCQCVYVCLMMMSNPPTLLVLSSEPHLYEPFPLLLLPAPPLSEEYTGQASKSEHSMAVRLKHRHMGQTQATIGFLFGVLPSTCPNKLITLLLHSYNLVGTQTFY